MGHDTLRGFPSFDRPPVIETVLGIQFAPIKGWGVPHFGLYWEKIRSEYPRWEVMPALGDVPDLTDADRFQQQLPKLELLTDPQVRCWFFHNEDERLLQVQRDRFLHNWRKGKGGAAHYPRYSVLRSKFLEAWTSFAGFLEASQLPAPEVNQCEVSYINHIDRETLWQTFSDLPNVLAILTGLRKPRILGAMESAQLACTFEMPERRGRLHVSLQHALRNTDLMETLQLTLTARGRPQDSQIDSVLSWMDLGREWVVKGFVDLTTSRAHKHWGLRESE